MPSKVLELKDVLQPDALATRLTEKWQEWDSMRQLKKNDWKEIRQYVYATDTTQTSNSLLPWKNKTTVPKLCQIRDNLYANYTATLFPQRKWLVWEANEKDANSVRKRDAIVNYMSWAIAQPSFKEEIDKIILDYIDYGNCIATVEWLDERVERKNGTTQMGYVGPCVRRISPLDCVMNPTTENFRSSPKFVRSIINRGELKELLERLSNDDNREEYEALYRYLSELRSNAHAFEGDWIDRDNAYQIDGFTSFRAYLQSELVEVLTFYGDVYDYTNDTLLKNHVITIVDRHKLIGKKPNPSFFGYPPIFHAPWRRKQDNLWGMGPLDNLVGMQYRIDHIENMKADIFDLTTYPVQKIKGFVEAYTWQPGEQIFVSEEGDVELVQPDVNIMMADTQIQTYYNLMEARRNLTGVTAIKVFDDDLKVASFQALVVEDITGIGRIKPVAARHFAEQAQMVQNLSSLAQSPLWATVQPHFSGIKMAKMFEDYFNLKDLEMVIPYVALGEQADGQKQANSLQEQIMQESATASGMGDDFDQLPPPGAM